VVAAKQEEVLRVFYLVSQEEAGRLQRLFATVDIVAKELVSGLGRESTVLDAGDHRLPADVATNLVRRFQL